jgi:hypothetical protein
MSAVFQSSLCLEHQMKAVQNVSLSPTLSTVVLQNQEERTATGELCSEDQEEKYPSSKIIRKFICCLLINIFM